MSIEYSIRYRIDGSLLKYVSTFTEQYAATKFHWFFASKTHTQIFFPFFWAILVD